MPSIYLFDQNSVSKDMFITLVDKEGNKYRVQFCPFDGGFVVSKTNDVTGNDQIAAYPKGGINVVRIK
jgi:hypothetical protein